MVWNEIKENDFWHPEKSGDNISGVLVDVQGKKGEVSAIYNLEVVKGENLMVWGSTILDKRMEKVEVGNLVRITFKGREPVKDAKKQDVKIFKVEVWEEEEKEQELEVEEVSS